VQDDGYFQILKNCDHGGWALEQSRKVAPGLDSLDAQLCTAGVCARQGRESNRSPRMFPIAQREKATCVCLELLRNASAHQSFTVQ
jgi:hypothetical protein